MCITGTFFGIIGLVFSIIFRLYSYHDPIYPVGFVWFLPTWPLCVLLFNSRRCLKKETWTISCYVLGIVSAIMTLSGFVYEIIATAGNCDLNTLVTSFVFFASQIYVISSLLVTFILSIYGMLHENKCIMFY